ncbi:unnamed protein product [Effrenium voratum]|nr:unnamed protein product [Effrenium voratum]
MVVANQVLERGGRVLVLEKAPFCGGNSVKATAGINFPKGDSEIKFKDDTVQMGESNGELAAVLCRNSLPDMNWLIDKFELDFAVVSKLSGHSCKRTYRTKDSLPGMAITYSLIKTLEKVAEVSDRARLVTKAEVVQLLFRCGNVVGCEYKKSGRCSKEYGPVVICTGGFGGAEAELLAKHRPELASWPTVSADHCTGDGLKLGEQVGAAVLGLEWVQLHPTALVHPDEPDAKRKVLAGEAFRLAGGLLLDAKGQRFCNEMGPAEHIVSQMQQNQAPFWLCLNTAASREMQWQCRTFISRKLMKCYASGRDLAAEMKVPLQTLIDVHDSHAEAFRRTMRSMQNSVPSEPAHSWDEASAKSGCGKLEFKHVLVGSRVPDEPFHVARVTPAIHFCPGGLQINTQAEVMKDGTKIPGLYAAGEAAGGVHGRQALPGNPLLDCVVFGRLAAKSACQYIFGKDDEFRPCPLQVSIAKVSLHRSNRLDSCELKSSCLPDAVL